MLDDVEEEEGWGEEGTDCKILSGQFCPSVNCTALPVRCWLVPKPRFGKNDNLHTASLHQALEHHHLHVHSITAPSTRALWHCYASKYPTCIVVKGQAV